MLAAKAQSRNQLRLPLTVLKPSYNIVRISADIEHDDDGGDDGDRNGGDDGYDGYDDGRDLLLLLLLTFTS